MRLTTVRVRKARQKTLKDLDLPTVESIEVMAYGSTVAIASIAAPTRNGVKVEWRSPAVSEDLDIEAIVLASLPVMEAGLDAFAGGDDE